VEDRLEERNSSVRVNFFAGFLGQTDPLHAQKGAPPQTDVIAGLDPAMTGEDYTHRNAVDRSP
jgi:hypothetical protein